MNFDIFEFSSRLQITTALVLIVVLLLYIAFVKPYLPKQARK
jgi:hypothetical protein